MEFNKKYRKISNEAVKKLIDVLRKGNNISEFVMKTKEQ